MLIISHYEQEEIRKMKADLGSLSKDEKESIEQDIETTMIFKKNPFFYAKVSDLLVDLNFKNYLKTNFNVVLVDSETMIEDFFELGKDMEEIFIGSVNSQKDKLMMTSTIENIIKNRSHPNLFYTTYKNALDINNNVFKLENFSETNEFFEGLDSSIKDECKVFPMSTKEVSNKHFLITNIESLIK